VTATSTTPGMSAVASAPVGSSVDVETQVSTGGPAVSAVDAAGHAVFVSASQAPAVDAVLQTLQGNGEVHHDFDVGGASSLFQLLSVGAAYPTDGSGKQEDFSLSFSQQIALGSVGSLQHLIVGFVAPSVLGDFDQVHFVLTLNGVAALDQTFSDEAALAAYFDDQSIDLGLIDGSRSTLSLGIAFDFVSHQVGSSFFASILYGNSTPGSGPAAPEPGSDALLAAALGGLAFARRRARAVRPRRSA
jgi:hypothetical protein